MMNAVMQRPLFRQTGSPDTGEMVFDPRKFNILDKLGVISNKTLNMQAPDKEYQLNIDDAMTNPQLLDTVFEMITSSTGFDLDAFLNMGESQRDDYLKTIKGRLIFGKAEGGEMKSDAVGIADGLDQEEPMTVDRDPSKEGIAKVSPEQYVELMNDVRGDEVSMEGRVQELASVVGEKDAQDTPLSVLALVQPVFEMKEQQGIAQTQGAQNMMPRASDQLANPQNMGIVRAQSGLIVDAPFNFRNMPSVSIQGDSTFANTIPLTGTPTPTATPNFMDTSNTLISDFMKQYVTPVKMDAATLQSEIDLLKGIMGDSKKEGQRALATTGVDLGLRLAAGEDINSLLREASANLFKITKAVKDADKAIALQAYKSLLSRKNTMSEREFNLAKLGLENQLKMLFEQSKGMEKPTYLRDPKSGKVIVLDQIRDAKKIADLLDGGFVPVSATAQQPILEQTFTTVQENKDGGEIVKRSTGSNQNGEQSGGSLTYEEAMEGIQSGEMGVPFEQQFGQGGMELIKDKATITKYQNRIILGQELEDLLLESISLIENNPKLAGLVGDAIQVAQKGVLPINQLFEVFGGTSPIPERVTEFLSDPAIQRLSTLEQLIPEKLINFQKDISSNRIPAMNRIFDQRGKLNISGFSDATRAVNTLKGILADVRDGSNMMREAIGRDPVPYGSKLDMILQQFNLTKDDDLVKQALDAIEQKPEAESQILDSLLEKLKQQSGQ
tara:strand:+ start:366 stop:2543 length:2178 start_codon:yes stop_codon:yes gene_type:complete